MTESFTYQLNELEHVARQLLETFGSKVILFKGDIGSGKTTLIKALLEQMGSEDSASSPSFSLVNEYHTTLGKVYHFDLYRIEDPSELWDFGFEEYLSSGEWLFIEWPEQITDYLEQETVLLELKTLTTESRSLKLTIKNRVLTENSAMTDI